MSLDAIKKAIEQLPMDQQAALASWLTERDWAAWDQQIEHDFSPVGRGARFLAELDRSIDEGETQPMEVGLANRNKPRQ